MIASQPMKRVTALWTDEELSHVRHLLTLGLSRGEMAQQMNLKFSHRTYTRNMVIGVVNRMQIAEGHAPKARIGRPKKQVFEKPHRRPSLPGMKTWREVAIATPLEPVYKLKGTCEFILSDGAPYIKCGKECRGSWCEEHEKLVTLPRNAVRQSRQPFHSNPYSFNRF
jgi:hypothetical protein